MRIRFHRSSPARREVGFSSKRANFWVTPDRARHAPAVKLPNWSTLVVHLELGSSNALFIRGQGGTLRWDFGQQLVQVEPGTWVWSTGELTGQFEFQLLLNDEVWERGAPHVLDQGHTLHVIPDFEWPDIPKVSGHTQNRQPA